MFRCVPCAKALTYFKLKSLIKPGQRRNHEGYIVVNDDHNFEMMINNGTQYESVTLDPENIYSGLVSQFFEVKNLKIPVGHFECQKYDYLRNLNFILIFLILMLTILMVILISTYLNTVNFLCKL